jgi:hypothetical protein
VGAGVGQQRLLGGEAVVLVGVLDTDFVELGDLEAQEVDLAGPGALVAPKLDQLGIDRRQLGIGVAKGLQVDATEPVERPALDRAGEQALVGVLAVQVDQFGTACGERRRRRQVAVEVRTAASLPWHHSTEHDLLLRRSVLFVDG